MRVAYQPAGLAAALCEERIWRGLLVPRLGWLLPTIGFTATHADRYGPRA